MADRGRTRIAAMGAARCRAPPSPGACASHVACYTASVARRMWPAKVFPRNADKGEMMDFRVFGRRVIVGWNGEPTLRFGIHRDPAGFVAIGCWPLLVGIGRKGR